jgi:hypothetical protein
MNTETIFIDMTMPELHKHIKGWQVRNPNVDDASVALEMAIAERWPGADVHEILRHAAVNWLSQDRMNMARESAMNPKKWIDTTVQNDMFNDMPMSVPEYIIQDGKAIEYWKCTLPTMLEFFEARIQSLETQHDALIKSAKIKRKEIDCFASNALKVRAAIERACELGVDPSTLKYAKH